MCVCVWLLCECVCVCACVCVCVCKWRYACVCDRGYTRPLCASILFAVRCTSGSSWSRTCPRASWMTGTRVGLRKAASAQRSCVRCSRCVLCSGILCSGILCVFVGVCVCGGVCVCLSACICERECNLNACYIHMGCTASLEQETWYGCFICKYFTCVCADRFNNCITLAQPSKTSPCCIVFILLQTLSSSLLPASCLFVLIITPTFSSFIRLASHRLLIQTGEPGVHAWRPRSHIYKLASCLLLNTLLSDTHVDPGIMCMAGQNRIYTIYNRIFGGFPAKNIVYTVYNI